MKKLNLGEILATAGGVIIVVYLVLCVVLMGV